MKPLLALLRAPSRAEVESFFDDIFTQRNGEMGAARREQLYQMLRLSSHDELHTLLDASRTVVWQLTESAARPAEGDGLGEAVAALFPESFHEDLKELITSVLVSHTPKWRRRLEQLGPPSATRAVATN